MSWFLFFLRCALGTLLLVAAGFKLYDGPTVGATFVAGYRILPLIFVAPFALALPYIELFLGLYLIMGLFVRIVAFTVTLQFLIFAAAVSSLIVRHLPANCGCFGSVIPTVPSFSHVMVDLLLALSSFTVFWFGGGVHTLDARLSNPRSGSDELENNPRCFV